MAGDRIIHKVKARARNKKGKVTVSLVCGAKPNYEEANYTVTDARVTCPKCKTDEP